MKYVPGIQEKDEIAVISLGVWPKNVRTPEEWDAALSVELDAADITRITLSNAAALADDERLERGWSGRVNTDELYRVCTHLATAQDGEQSPFDVMRRLFGMEKDALLDTAPATTPRP